MAVRVLRLMEYVYEDAEAAQEDMENWYIPANGSRRKGIGRKQLRISSATTIDFKFLDEDPSDPGNEDGNEDSD